MNNLSPELISQLLAQESNDPFLTLVTLTHTDFTVRLVNNSVDITSNGYTFTALPMKIRLPVDDGETTRDFTLEIDNVSLDLIGSLRSVTGSIGVSIELVLASIPNVVQMSFYDLTLRSLTYNSQRISAKVSMDNFLSVAMTSERYDPTTYPGLF